MMKTVYEGFPIEQLIPEGVELSEIQKGYLEAVAYLFGQKEQVKMIDVARLMDKPTGSVHSAMMVLAEKGILETNHDGDIRLLLRETVEAKEKEEASAEPASSSSLIDGYSVIDGQIMNDRGETIPDAHYTVLHLSVRAFNVLTREQNKIKASNHESLMISDLLNLTMERLAGLRNLGAKSIPEIIEELSVYLEHPEFFGHAKALDKPADAVTKFAPEYEIVDKVIRHKETSAIVEDASVRELGLKGRNWMAVQAGGFQNISDLVQVDFDVFRNRTKLGKLSTREVSDALQEYLQVHQVYYGQDGTAKVIVTPKIIMDFFGNHEFDRMSKETLLAEFEGMDEEVLFRIIDSLIQEGKLGKEGNSYHKFHRSFFQYAFTSAMDDYPKLKTDYLDILRWRSLGNTLEEVGQSRGLTRERVRQIEQKALDILTERRHIYYQEDEYS